MAAITGLDETATAPPRRAKADAYRWDSGGAATPRKSRRISPQMAASTYSSNGSPPRSPPQRLAATPQRRRATTNGQTHHLLLRNLEEGVGNFDHTIIGRQHRNVRPAAHDEAEAARLVEQPRRVSGVCRRGGKGAAYAAVSVGARSGFSPRAARQRRPAPPPRPPSDAPRRYSTASSRTRLTSWS